MTTSLYNRIRAFRRGTRWTPVQLGASLATWHTAGPAWCFQDAAGTIPCGNGDLIYLWKDRSGNGSDYTQGTALCRPTLTLAGGRWAATFDGTACFMSAPIAAAQPFWGWAATNPTDVTGTRRLLDSTDRALFGFAGGQYELYAGTDLLVAGATTGPRVLGVLLAGAASKMYSGGGAAVLAGNAGAAGSGGTVYLGADNTGNVPYQGTVGELICTGPLAAGNVDRVGAYLAANFGVTWSPHV